MTLHTLANIRIGLSAFNASIIHSKSKAFGLFLPSRNDQIPHLVDGDGDTLSVLPLEGPYAFGRHVFELGTTMEGLLFSEVRFVVNVHSRLKPGREATLGDFRIGEGRAHIMSFDRKSGWRDAEAFSIPVDVPMSAEKPVTFREWSIHCDYRQDEIELWRRTEESKEDP